MKLRYENTADWKRGNIPWRHSRSFSVFVCVIGLTAPIVWSASSADKKNEPIGAVDDIYDGTLAPDLQVSTFRRIDRVFPSRTVLRGTSVYPLPVSEMPLKSFKFKSGRNTYDLVY